MGYTHYYKRNPSIEPSEAYGHLQLDAKRIIEAAAGRGVHVQFEYDDDNPPELSEGGIRFNGVGEDGHETFVWQANVVNGLRKDIEWAKGENERLVSYFEAQLRDVESGGNVGAFCKTARKPYDLVVCAILLRAELHYGDSIEVSSDGDMGPTGEWNDARLLNRVVFAEVAA